MTPTQKVRRVQAKAKHLASGKVPGLGDPIFELSLMVSELCEVLLSQEKDTTEAWKPLTEGTIR